MIVDLKKLKYYFLTTGKNDMRKNHILDIFKDFDITEVNPLLGLTRCQSGSIGTGRMIDIGLRRQERNKPFQPFVVLEDDVSFYRDFPENFELPDDADLFYIGISKYGAFNYSDKLIIMAEDIDKDTVRIYNMLSSHAIIICSPLGASIYQRTMVDSYCNNVPWDLSIAHLQPYYKVYALKVPLLFQDSKYGGQEEPTKFELTEYIPPNDKYFYKYTVSYAMSYDK